MLETPKTEKAEISFSGSSFALSAVWCFTRMEPFWKAPPASRWAPHQSPACGVVTVPLPDPGVAAFSRWDAQFVLYLNMWNTFVCVCVCDVTSTQLRNKRGTTCDEKVNNGSAERSPAPLHFLNDNTMLRRNNHAPPLLPPAPPNLLQKLCHKNYCCCYFLCRSHVLLKKEFRMRGTSCLRFFRRNVTKQAGNLTRDL